MNAIQKARLTAGLTQEQLADAVGICLSTVRRWEDDEIVSPMHRAKLIEVCPALNDHWRSNPRVTANNHPLVQARRAARLTQKEVARATGSTISAVGNWERGCRVPDKYREKLSTLLKVALVDPARSKYRGVKPHRNRWRAAITVKGEPLDLGLFDTEEEAARAYDAARIFHTSQDQRSMIGYLNFPAPVPLRNESQVETKAPAPTPPPMVAPRPAQTFARIVASVLRSLAARLHEGG